jgi:hypothetical protein
LIRAGLRLLKICFSIGALLALITSFIVFGYAIKIIGFLLAVLCVIFFIGVLVWAGIKEFWQSCNKKPPK